MIDHVSKAIINHPYLLDYTFHKNGKFGDSGSYLYNVTLDISTINPTPTHQPAVRASLEGREESTKHLPALAFVMGTDGDLKIQATTQKG